MDDRPLEAIVKHLDIPTSLKEFGVPAEDLEVWSSPVCRCSVCW